MAFHLRKLLYDDSKLPSECKSYCTINLYNKCLSSCIELCPYSCKYPLDEDDKLSPPPVFDDIITDSSKHHHKLKLFLTIPIAVISTILFFLLCFIIYKLCVKKYALRRRSINQAGENVPGPDPDAFFDEDHGPNQGPAVEHHVWYIRTVGLDPAVISEITIVKYKKGEGLVEGTDCSVCLSGFEENESLRLLPKCSHAFHLPCIDTWLTSHTTCPLCRCGIVKTAVSVPVVVQDSSPVEENLTEIPRTSSSMEELRIEDDMNSRNGVRLVGRSVSMDAISGSMVNVALENDSERNSDDQVKELDDGVVGKRDGGSGINQLLRLVGNLSIDRPACIKRSFSCSANV